MSGRRIAALLIAMLAVCGAARVDAGNPISARDDAPLRWSTAAAVTWNGDGGTLGQWNNSTAIFEFTQSFAVWSSVPTSDITFVRGTQIVNPQNNQPVDVTSATFSAVLNTNNGQNPIIFDNGLDIFTAAGLPPSVIGVGGPILVSGTSIVKSYVLINGEFFDGNPGDIGEVSVDTFRHILTHEIGHFAGLGHSSVNHELTSGVFGCPTPTVSQHETMTPFSTGAEMRDLHHDDRMMLSHLYPSATFNTDNARVGGTVMAADRVLELAGVNIVIRPMGVSCGDLYDFSQSAQSGANPGEYGGEGSYEFPGLTPAGDYSLFATSLLDGGTYPRGAAFVPEEYWNGVDEDHFDPPDDPAMFDTVTAGAAGSTTGGFDILLNNPAGPGGIDTTGADALYARLLDGTTALPSETLSVDIEFGEELVILPPFQQAAFVNRFVPTAGQLPLTIDRLEAYLSRNAFIDGRPIRVLVYSDPAATGDIANATLVYTEDTVIPNVGQGANGFDFYPLTPPPTITTGDFYVGLYDLVADAQPAFGVVDPFISGDSWLAVGSTAPMSFNPVAEGNWYIRARVTSTPPFGSVELDWGDPCNVAAFDGQDFVVYEGGVASLPGVQDHAPITCSTGLDSRWVVGPGPDDRFFLVTPRVGTREGELGTGSQGQSRAPQTTCATTMADACP